MRGAHAPRRSGAGEANARAIEASEEIGGLFHPPAGLGLEAVLARNKHMQKKGGISSGRQRRLAASGQAELGEIMGARRTWRLPNGDCCPPAGMGLVCTITCTAITPKQRDMHMEEAAQAAADNEDLRQAVKQSAARSWGRGAPGGRRMAIAAHLGIGISLHNYMHSNHAKATQHAHVKSAQQQQLSPVLFELAGGHQHTRPVEQLRCLQHL